MNKKLQKKLSQFIGGLMVFSTTCVGELVVTFEQLGDIAGLSYFGTPDDVSIDGSVIVGNGSGFDIPQEGYRWEEGSVTGLRPIVEVFAASDDGSKILGLAKDDPDEEWGRFAMWEDGNVTDLLDQSGNQISGWPWRMSGDGSTVAGVRVDTATMETDLIRWKDSTVEIVGDVVADYGGIKGLSRDGNIMVGVLEQGLTFPSPRKWQNGEWSGLWLVQGYVGGVAYDVSDDGSIIAGKLYDDNWNSRACRWRNGAPILLDNPPGAISASAYFISGNGKVILGEAGYDTEPWLDIVLWKVATQWQPVTIRSLLSAYQIDVNANDLVLNTNSGGALSGDGTTIVGRIDNPGDAFRLKVANLWGQFLIDNKFADTTPWIGQVYVPNAPWVWSVDATQWFFVPDEVAQNSEGWIYLPKTSAP